MENNNTLEPTVHPNGAMDCYKAFWTNYATFSGRARLSEFWWPWLFNAIITLILSAVCGKMISGLFSLAILVPNLAVTSRRLHDTGRAFGWFFIYFIPIVGIVLLFMWTARDGERGENRFGANPKIA